MGFLFLNKNQIWNFITLKKVIDSCCINLKLYVLHLNSRLGLTLKNRPGHFHPTVFTFRCSAVAYSFSLVSGLHLRFFSLFLSFPESAVWF